jgi:hypothetical protein
MGMYFLDRVLARSYTRAYDRFGRSCCIPMKLRCLGCLVCMTVVLGAAGALGQYPSTGKRGVYVQEYKGDPGVLPGETALTPLQTELIGPLDISRLKVGSAVLTKLDVAWTGRGCTLALKSILAGHVAEIDARTKQNPISRVTLVFDTADCNGTPSAPFATGLVAVLAGRLGGDPDLAEGPALADAVGLSTGGGARSAQAASAITDYSALPIRKLPAQVMPGQVVGLRRIRLSVGTGVDGGSVLSSPNHDLRLESTTHFILMPPPPKPGVVAAAPSPAGVPGSSSSVHAAAASPANARSGG